MNSPTGGIFSTTLSRVESYTTELRYIIISIFSTHRERKEYYVKALEQEVLRLRECVNEISHENNRITEENIKLKELLRQHDIPFSETENRHRPDDSYHIGQTDGGGGGSNPIINTSITNPHEPMPPHDNMNLNPQGNDNTSSRQGGGTKLDYDQIGIDFVLTYVLLK